MFGCGLCYEDRMAKDGEKPAGDGKTGTGTANKAPAGPTVRSLWPTQFLEQELPGHALANEELNKLVKSMDRAAQGRGADLTTDYLGGNLLDMDHPAIGWLRDCINASVIDYLKAAGMDYKVDWSLQGWANVNRFGDYHDLHNHPHSYLSGTYYVRVPDEMEKLKTRPDVRPGCITFYDPRGAVNMTAIRGDGQIEAEHTVKPTPGTLLLWPAFVHHFVHPNLSKQARVSISFNVILKWRDEYLPEQ